MASHISRLLRGLLASACTLLMTPALAATLYGTIGSGGTPSVLVQLNPETGALERTIGPVGYGVNGMVSGRDGTMYAITRGGDPLCPRGLLRIDLSTGAGTPIGCGASGVGERPALLTADASGRLCSWYEPDSDDLITWNKVAGTYSAPIGDSGLNTGQHTLAFNVPGTTLYLLYGSNLYTIDPTTGASAFVGAVSGVSDDDGPHHGDFNPDDGWLYAISCADCPDPQLLVIDVASRMQVRSSATVSGLHTLAFFGPAGPAPLAQAIPIPVDNPWALGAVVLLLAAFGTFHIRRQA